MCRKDDVKGGVRSNSTMSGSSSSEYSSDSFDLSIGAQGSPHARHPMLTKVFDAGLDGGAATGNAMSFVYSSVGGIVLGFLLTGFSLWFPFVLAPELATKTYIPAYWNYDPKVSLFDNTAWTYGTDYGLAVVMTLLGLNVLSLSRAGISDVLSRRSAAMLFGYAISTAAGGYGHQFFLTLESRNTLVFQLLWTVCVGTVCTASTFMGISASETVRRFQKHPDCPPLARKFPVVPEPVWWAFGIVVAGVCACGGMSFHRPACDIFIAGTTQVPSTFYLMAFLFFFKHPHVKTMYRIFGLVGFILNAPLLPGYPILVHLTNLCLGHVNAVLHSVLFLAWTMQGLCLRHLVQALNSEHEDKQKAEKQN